MERKKLWHLFIGLFIFVALLSSLFSCRNVKPKDSMSAASLISLYDDYDNKVNEGKGYSEYLNTDGFPTGALLAWSESYLMQSYVNMYQATKNVKYLDKLYDHIISVLSRRDDKIGKRNYRGELAPTWGTDRFTHNKEWMDFAVVTGMITYPMLEFVQLAKTQKINKYSNEIGNILYEAEQAVNYHNSEWKGLYYVYPPDFYKKDYIIPISQQATLGRSLILLYDLTGKQEYLEKVKSLAEFIKNVGIEKRNGEEGYLLKQGFLPGKTIPEDNIVDISHAGLTIHFAYLCYKRNIVFEKSDMEGFARSIKQLAVLNNGRFPKFMDGRPGDFSYEIAAGQYIFLAEFDKDIYGFIYNLLFKHLNIQYTLGYMQEDWWGFTMLNLSRVVLYLSHNKE